MRHRAQLVGQGQAVGEVQLHSTAHEPAGDVVLLGELIDFALQVVREPRSPKSPEAREDTLAKSREDRPDLLGLHVVLEMDGHVIGSGHLVQYLDQRVSDSSVELAARAALQLDYRIVDVHAGTVRTGGDHRLKGIRDRQHPGQERYLLAPESRRVPLSVPSFVMVPDDGRDRPRERDRPQDVRPDERMMPHLTHLLVGQTTRLQQYLLADADLPDVVQIRRHLERGLLLLREAEFVGDGDRVQRDSVRMAAGVCVLRVDRRGKRSYRCEVRLLQAREQLDVPYGDRHVVGDRGQQPHVIAVERVIGVGAADRDAADDLLARRERNAKGGKDSGEGIDPVPRCSVLGRVEDQGTTFTDHPLGHGAANRLVVDPAGYAASPRPDLDLPALSIAQRDVPHVEVEDAHRRVQDRVQQRVHVESGAEGTTYLVQGGEFEDLLREALAALAQRVGHGVEAVGQLGYLVGTTHLDLGGEVAVRDALSAPRESHQRPRDSVGDPGA